MFGELYRLRQPKELLREFDMYEACGEGFAEPTEYVRQMLPVTLGDGAASEAWTYIYNWPVADLPRIDSGRFLERVGRRSSFRAHAASDPASICRTACGDDGFRLAQAHAPQ